MLNKIFILEDFKRLKIYDILNLYQVLRDSSKFNKSQIFIIGQCHNNIAFIKYLINKMFILCDDIQLIALILKENLNIDKIYLDNNYSRIIQANYGDSFADLNGDLFLEPSGSMTNWSNFMYTDPVGLKFPDFQDKYINNSITKIKYGPEIDRKWDFIEPRDHAEWLMQDTR